MLQGTLVRRHGLRRRRTLYRKFRLPLPESFSGIPVDWQERAWNFKSYISMFETGAVALLDNAERRTDEFLDEHWNVALDTGDVDAEQAEARALLSRKLPYLTSQLVKDSPKLSFDKTKIAMVLRLGRHFSRSSRCQELRAGATSST